ncbi:MAG: hypothetical protein WAV73_05740 [Candidatus Moraniibacteriota bacterium]
MNDATHNIFRSMDALGEISFCSFATREGMNPIAIKNKDLHALMRKVVKGLNRKNGDTVSFWPPYSSSAGSSLALYFPLTEEEQMQIWHQYFLPDSDVDTE